MSQKKYPNKKKIYLDHAATTPDKSRPISLIDIDHWGGYGNSHSIHQLGLEAVEDIRKAEQVILDYINGQDGKLIYTGSGSQANELAIRAMCESYTLLTTEIEHKSILQHCNNFAYDKVAPDKYGNILAHEVAKKVYETTDLVSVQMVNNITGVVNPIKEIRRAIPNHVFLHTDAVQVFGKLKIDVQYLGVDLMTLSSHKMYGPKGLGILWVSNRALGHRSEFFPYMGTQPTELICRTAYVLRRRNMQEEANWVAVLEHKFLQDLQNLGVNYELASGFNRVAGMLCIRFPGIDADSLVFSLSRRGICISSGSACDGGKVEPSHVLLAMGIPYQVANEMVRISIGYTNSMADMRETALAIANIIKESQNGS